MKPLTATERKEIKCLFNINTQAQLGLTGRQFYDLEKISSHYSFEDVFNSIQDINFTKADNKNTAQETLYGLKSCKALKADHGILRFRQESPKEFEIYKARQLVNRINKEQAPRKHLVKKSSTISKKQRVPLKRILGVKIAMVELKTTLESISKSFDVVQEDRNPVYRMNSL